MFCINTAEVSGLSPSMSWPSLTVCSIHIFNAAGNISKDDQRPLFPRPFFATKSYSFTFQVEFDIFQGFVTKTAERKWEGEKVKCPAMQCITWLLAVSTLYAHCRRLSLVCCRCPSGLVHYLYDMINPFLTNTPIEFHSSLIWLLYPLRRSLMRWG